MMNCLHSDFEFQSHFVAANAWRLAAMQDKTPLSPSFGCFDYKYWRDKTSEFPDARFQEASASLGLLSLSEFDRYRSAGVLDSGEELYRLFSAGVRQWHAMQYPDGSFDEWYKGERGFAAAAFTTIAFGLAVHFLGANVSAEDRAKALVTIRKTCDWLINRDDLVKTNHNAAGSAALAIGFAVTGEQKFADAARRKMRTTLRQQTEEGWFPEIGAMDLGYSFVLMDYVMLYVHFSRDFEPIPAMKKLMAFLTAHLHPDGTVAAEAGSCLNGYVSRVGVGLLSAHDENASDLVALLSNSSPGREGLLPTLADDLRFARWSHLPLVAQLLRKEFRPGDKLRYPPGWTVHASSASATFHDGKLDVYVAGASGGGLRIFTDGRSVVEDLGIYASRGGKMLVAGYDPNRLMRLEGGELVLEAVMGEASFLYPGFLARLVLRLGAVTAWSSVWLRRAIDWYRLRSNTALNQSATSTVKRSADLKYRRSIMIVTDGVIVTDRLEQIDGAAPALELRCKTLVAPEIFETREPNTLILTRRFDFSRFKPA